jgi:hypothetical protein
MCSLSIPDIIVSTLSSLMSFGSGIGNEAKEEGRKILDAIVKIG